MKQNDFEDLKKLSPKAFANLFNIYDEPKLGETYITYNINRTINFTNLSSDARDDSANNAIIKYTVERGDTWPLVSYKHYNNIDLWWLIAKCNDVINPTIDPIPGTVIRILREQYINDVLRAIRTFE